MSVGFTGTQIGLTDYQIEHLIHTLQELGNNQEFHHGDCIGADALAAFHAHRLGFEIVCHPPINSSKRAWTKFHTKEWEAKEYLVRNHDIVDCSDILIACPKTVEEELRSGTWATVRYARKKNKPIQIIYP